MITELDVEAPNDEEYGNEECTCKVGHTDCTFPEDCNCNLHFLCPKSEKTRCDFRRICINCNRVDE